MSTDLQDMEIDNGAPIEKDYDAEEDADAPKEKILNLGYGKAQVSSNKLLITSPNVFVPNAYDYLGPDGKKVSAGYFSFSALNTYRRCQKLFYFRYVEKLRFAQPAPKMWGGSGIHDTIEMMLNERINNKEYDSVIRAKRTQDSILANTGSISSGNYSAMTPFSLDDVSSLYGKELPFTNESAKRYFTESYGEFESGYAQAKARAINNGEPALPEINYGAKVSDVGEFHIKYLNAIDAYIAKEYPLVNPVSTEELIIHHFDLDDGGTVPIVGFIDLVEKTDFMVEYHNEVARDGSMTDEKKEYAKKTIKNIDNGELMITDHKCGMAKNYEQARTEDQLTLYSMAKDIPVVGFNSLKLGTTGGKRPDKAKPATIKKIFARRTQRDYESLTTDFNAIIKGISSGIFDKSGKQNSMVCSPTLCPAYEKCFGSGK